MKTSLALVGFMGAGKTAVGKVLARKLNKEFIELDSLIEQKAGKTIPEIFNKAGEIRFRELEIEVTKEVAGKKHVVIACGGGVVLNKINIDRLRQEAIIVYLKAPPQVILKRVAKDENERPLLAENKARRVKELLSFRKPFYERAAEITIDTSKLDIDSVARHIIEEFKKNESLN